MTSLPYVTSSGNIPKALDGIRSAAVPERVSQDFVKTVLMIPGGSGDQMTAFLKKIGLADASGRPTEAYKKFRNPATSRKTLGLAIKKAYSPLFVRNEYAHKLSENDLLGLIVEATGQAHDSNPVKMTFQCFKALKEFADFDEEGNLPEHGSGAGSSRQGNGEAKSAERLEVSSARNFDLNLGYTINLNLPASSDPAVFNAIFKSLKEHLLSNDDG